MSVEIECTIKHETERAMLVVVHATGEEVWLPLSQVDEIHRESPARVVVSDWIAREKGLC